MTKHFIYTILKQRSVQTILVLSLYILTASLLPPTAHQLLYTSSLFIKDILIWIMPLTVGFFIAYTVSSFENKAPAFILSLICFEGFSNLSSVWYTFSFASLSIDSMPLLQGADLKTGFTALWRLPFQKPAWWAADKGCIVGLIIGCIAALRKNDFLSRILYKGKKIMEFILTRFFARLIPLFILGFAAHLHQTRLLQQIFLEYSVLLSWLLIALCLYITFLFAVAAGFDPKRTVNQFKNLLPAGGIALTSGCSLSTMPWTIQGTSKNLQNPKLAEAIIPATTNIQQIGDCIANTFLCFVIYKHFNGHAPDISTWFTFSIAFTIARFATAAVIGGAIFIMLPIYEVYLNFTPEMIAIILAFNVLLDPIITSSNVIANGALCCIFERFWMWLEAFSVMKIRQHLDI